MRTAVAAGLAALLPLCPPAATGVASLTVPANGISSCKTSKADGGLTNDPADFAVTSPTADTREITVAAAASDGSSFPGLYEGSFAYSCVVTGAGSLAYGSAAGTLSVDAASTPDALQPTPNNPNDPFSNSGYARGEALLQLQFDDGGTVVSDTLAAGTPVELVLHLELASSALATGPPLGPLLGASATFFASATDVAAPGAPVEALLIGNEMTTRTLSTAVGRTVEIHGQLSLHVVGHAGREVPGALYYPSAIAAVDASNTALFQLSLPAGVAFESESGHDYTTAAAPGEPGLVGAGAAALAAARRARRARQRTARGAGAAAG